MSFTKSFKSEIVRPIESSGHFRERIADLYNISFNRGGVSEYMYRV